VPRRSCGNVAEGYSVTAPVRVPADAVEGKAIIRFELPQDSEYVSSGTDIMVELISKTKGK